MSSESYFIPAAQVETEEVIKKSRFVSYLAPVTGRDSAMAFIHSLRELHPDARHHCWAFIAGTPGDAQQWGFSDDGEPGGTAGKPMLAQLTGSGLGEICAVVVRYSGGIKLGTGGLVKAYGGGVASALKLLSTTEKIPFTQLVIHCGYHQLKTIEHLLQQHNGHIDHTNYAEQLKISCSVDSRNKAELLLRIQDAGSGNILVEQQD